MILSDLSNLLRDGTPIADWRNISEGKPIIGDLAFKFADALNAPRPTISVSIPVVYSLGVIQKDRFALDWLQSLSAGKQLVGPKSKIVFPKLKKLAFWKSLSLMDVETAASQLKGRLDSVNTETVAFFGISVNKTVALWAGPLVCFMIEWLFLLHLENLSNQVIEAGIAKDCPWIALYNGRRSEWTTYISLLFPVMADLILLYNYGHSGWITILGYVLTLLTAVTEMWIILQLRQLRRRMSDAI